MSWFNQGVMDLTLRRSDAVVARLQEIRFKADQVRDPKALEILQRIDREWMDTWRPPSTPRTRSRCGRQVPESSR